MFEGKIIKATNPDGKTYDAVVIACEPDVGITIAKQSNIKHNLYCLNGPLSPHFSKSITEENTVEKATENFNVCFAEDVKMIEEGHLDAKKQSSYEKDKPGFGLPSCAFGA